MQYLLLLLIVAMGTTKTMIVSYDKKPTTAKHFYPLFSGRDCAIVIELKKTYEADEGNVIVLIIRSSARGGYH